MIMPLLVATSMVRNEELILFFWPTSIVLLGLGTGGNSLRVITTFWTTAVLGNVLLYLAIGLTLRLIAKLSRRQ